MGIVRKGGKPKKEKEAKDHVCKPPGSYLDDDGSIDGSIKRRGLTSRQVNHLDHRSLWDCDECGRRFIPRRHSDEYSTWYSWHLTFKTVFGKRYNKKTMWRPGTKYG